MDNYNVIHLHSDFSNGTTNIDSVTKFKDYIVKAKELGMKAIAFTEHGNVFSWIKKKLTCDEYGIKYIHGCEVYITENLETKVRDNYHTCLYAKNYDGVQEINNLLSDKNANNRQDGHFYYVPRITLEEFLNISDNVIVTSACLGGVLAKGKDKEISKIYLNYFIKNKDRCFLEIQHHLDENQINHNNYLVSLAEQYDLRLITGTDTHALNEEYLDGRAMLQRGKGIHFGDEDSWDLAFKSYDELIAAYKKQNSLDMEIVKGAMNNTNVLSDMVEEFEIDRSYKYPKLYADGENVFKKKINEGIKKKGVHKLPNFKSDYKPRIQHELNTYRKSGAIDFMLLEEDLMTWCHKNDIYQGYGRGSCTGSEIAYLLEITEMDSIKHKLNFERFMNLERVSLG